MRPIQGYQIDGQVIGESHLIPSSLSEASLDANVVAKLNNTLSRKLNATRPPSSTDDGANTSGEPWSYGTVAQVGSVWLDTSNGETYRCVDATTNAAIWVKTSIDADELGDLAFLSAASIAQVTGLQTALDSQSISITNNATAITTKANDADVVKLTGNQTIDDTKTFTGYVKWMFDNDPNPKIAISGEEGITIETDGALNVYGDMWVGSNSTLNLFGDTQITDIRRSVDGTRDYASSLDTNIVTEKYMAKAIDDGISSLDLSEFVINSDLIFATTNITESQLHADVQAKLNNTLSRKLDAIADPRAIDDAANTGAATWSHGSSAQIGSLWVNTTTGETFRCVDTTTGAAVWVKTSIDADELGDLAFLNNASIAHVTSLQSEIDRIDGVNTAQDTAIAARALDADVVKLTGNQTIAGTKTFSDFIQTSALADVQFKSDGTVRMISNTADWGTYTSLVVNQGGLNSDTVTPTGGAYVYSTDQNFAVGGSNGADQYDFRLWDAGVAGNAGQRLHYNWQEAGQSAHTFEIKDTGLYFDSVLLADTTYVSNATSNLLESQLHADVQAKLNNTLSRKLDATTAPTANDDGVNTGGATWSYGTAAQVGSVWVDTTNGETYRCVDTTTGAAQWIKTSIDSSELGDLAFLSAASIAQVTGLQAALDSQSTSISNNATAITTKANDADVVKLTGNQTVAGDKTFTGTGIFNGTQLVTSASTVLNVGGYLSFGGTMFTGRTQDLSLSASSVEIPTAQSVKLYVDSQVSSGVSSIDLAPYALDADVVKLTGNQSIAGDKTFTGSLLAGTDLQLGGHTAVGVSTNLTTSAASNQYASAAAIKTYVDNTSQSALSNQNSTYTADGVGQEFTYSVVSGQTNVMLIVAVNGIIQAPTTYTDTGLAVSLGTTPNNGDLVNVIRMYY